LYKNTININSNFNLVIKKLNILKDKILIVLDEKSKVVGSITDGDVRRFFFKKKRRNIKNLMNPNPLVIYKNKPLIISGLKKKIFKYAPLVDRNKKFIKLVNLKNFFDIDAVSVLIMAGGKGLRLRPLTKTIPKPLIQIKNITLLDRIIMSLLKEKLIDFNISVNYQKNKIINHIVKKFSKNISIKFIKEKNFLGTAGSLNLLKTKKKIILVINADIYTNLNFKNIINHHLENNSDITVGIKENNVSNPYGLIQLSKDKIISYEEKPIQKYLFNAGIYVINNRAIDLIPKNKKFDMSELIIKALSKKKIVTPFYIYEEWKDIGNKETLINLEKKYNKHFK
jgi:dTDP-glucose pyrophosphorylase